MQEKGSQWGAFLKVPAVIPPETFFKIHKIEMYICFFVITIFMENWSRPAYVIMCDFI